jgi:hypothetical protein
MPPSKSFTTQYNGISNVLQNEVLISQAFDPKDTLELPAFKKFLAIWDTGATNTVISEEVIKQCDLKPIGMVEVHHTGGSEPVETFLINVILPNNVGIKELKVSRGKLFGANVLIGMDIIRRGDFAVTNYKGKTAFSFRMPSIECIDVVAQSKALSPIRSIPKVGRNNPCPCGSGKKYKKCCGRFTK